MPSAIDQVDRLMPVAYLMKRLLAVDRESQPDSQGFTQRMALPLPEANNLWQGRQKIVLRAFFLLDCLQDWLTPVDRYAHVPHRSLLIERGSSPILIGYLVQTLHKCLAGKAHPYMHVLSCETETSSALSKLWMQLCTHIPLACPSLADLCSLL